MDDRYEPDTQHRRRDTRLAPRRVTNRLDAGRSIVPTAEQRQLATTLYGTYVALLDVGFTEVAALAIITATVSGVSGTDD